MRIQTPGTVRRAALGAATTCLVLAAAATAADAPTTAVVLDHTDAVDGAPDLRRVAATRAKDGSVRLALSLADELKPVDLLTDADGAGPPGSICVRLWTVSTPRSTPPDLLACVTSQPDAKTLRATVTREVPGALPSSVATLTVLRPSATSVAMVVPGTLFATASRLRFTAEATRAGCVRLSCVDLAPDLGATKTLRLR